MSSPDRAGDGVVGGGREPEIARIGRRNSRRTSAGFGREWAGSNESSKKTLGGRRRHELRDALRTLAV